MVAPPATRTTTRPGTCVVRNLAMQPPGVIEMMTPCTADSRPGDTMPYEVSVVIPCLNEAETLGTCVKKARAALDEHGICGEIVVADNGSTDDSTQIAERLGARVVPVTARGYGNALMGGIAAARGRYVIMG